MKSFVNFGKNCRVNVSCIKLAASLPIIEILIRVEIEGRSIVVLRIIAGNIVKIKKR